MNYPTLTLSTLLNSWGFDIQEKSISPVRVVRHAGQGGTPKALYNTGLETFEKYQAYQSKKIFGNAEYLVVFLGLEKNISSFIGIYRIVGLSKEGEQGYEPPFGPKELIKICNGSRYFYHLQREQKFDLFREKFTIRWNSQANRWCQQLQKEDKVIESFFDEQGGLLNPNLLLEWQKEKTLSNKINYYLQKNLIQRR